MKKHTLKGESREIVGRKVKRLRADGLLPVTVYGKKVDSQNLVVSASDFAKTYMETGETGLIELAVGSDLKPVLVHHVQRDPVRNTILHVEFHQVDLKEKVHANVPLVLVGEAPAVAQKVGVLLTLLSEIEVEALPTDLPEKIEVDVASLAEVGQELKVSDLRTPSGVAVLSDAAISVVKVGELVSKEAEEQAAAEVAAAEEAAAPAEGEAPAEDAEKPAEASAEKPAASEEKK
ncbi:50S ribosomal protein L25 [Patescibacteria group bacterium]|nr:50S ribosomal protein L25 [Patescibacteria group bacterium]